MKVDVIIEAGATARELSELGEHAEHHGINCLWACNFPGRRDPFVAQAAASASTERLKLGVMPISPYEIHPLKLSEMVATLQEVAGGRLQLLLGGLGKSVSSATGLEPNRRVRAVSEAIQIMGSLLDGKPTDFHGEIYQIRQQQFPWAPVRVPLYVAANGPKMLALAGRSADGVMMSDVVLEKMPECLDHLGSPARKSPCGFAVNNFWAWHVKSSFEDARAEAVRNLVWRGVLQRWHIEPFLDEHDCDFVEKHWSAFLQAFLSGSSSVEGVPDRIVDALVEGLTFTAQTSDLDPVLERLRRMEDAGMTEIALRLHENPLEAIRVIGEQVVPVISKTH